MTPKSIPDDLVERLYRDARADRWSVPVERFAAVIQASADRGAAADVGTYLRGLHLEDLALACACMAGDERAWEHFMRELRPVLYRAADALRPGGGARDLADSIYADLYGLQDRNGERRSLFRYFHGRSSLATWLRAVLAQRVVDAGRAERRLNPLPEEDGQITVASRPAPAPDPDRARYAAWIQRALGLALSVLGARDRLRLACYYSQELTLAETGRVLKEHEATVSRHLAKTRRTLRAEVERYLREEARLNDAQIDRCFECALEDAGPLDLGGMLRKDSEPIVLYDEPSRRQGTRGASEEHLMRETDQRDRSIEGLLRRRLEPGADLPATDGCVDAETLAAWMDGSLSGDALDRAEHHAAGCARCQAMVASMARTAPETAAGPWWRLLKVRWVVPIAAAATALVVWVSVDRQEKAALGPATTVQTSRAGEAPAPPTALADAQRPLAEPGHNAGVAEDKDARARSKAQAPAALRAERRSFSEPAAAGARGRSVDALGPSPQARSANAASVASPAAAMPAPAAPPPATPAVPNAAPAPVAEPLVARPLAETVTAPPESAAKEMRIAGRAADAAAFATGVEIMSPEPAFRWRLSAPARIQRSTDGGVTWKLQLAPAGIVLTAGSSPARDVCWIVGRAGAVLLSTDGTTWQLRPFPEAVNLTAVRALNAKNAVVTTSDGRQFSTTDGGATWSRLPL